MADLVGLAAALIAARADKADAEAAVKDANTRVEEATRELFDAMVDAELPKIEAQGHTFTLDSKTYYSCPAENSEALYAVLTERGRGDIFRHTANYQTLNATLREMADAEGDLPGDVAALVTAFDKGRVAVRKASTRK